MRKNAQKVIAVGFLVLAFAFYLGSSNSEISASTPPTHNVTGSANSSGKIGLINFSCDTDPNGCVVDYGVDISPSGVVTGEAWSPNVGWIAFDATYLSNCPITPCTISYSTSTGNLTGWAKVCGGKISSGALSTDINNACSGTNRVDKSDMWISLGTQLGEPVTYGAKFNTTTGSGSGYGWGSDVIGWVDFSGVKYEPTPLVTPSVTLKANGVPGTSTVLSGTTINLTWSGNDLKTGAGQCTFSGNLSGSVANPTSTGDTVGVNHGPFTNPSTTSRAYTITCTGTNNLPYSSSVTVNISTTGAPVVTLYANGVPGTSTVPSGTGINFTWAGSNLITGANKCQFSGNIAGPIANPTSTGNSVGVNQSPLTNPPLASETVNLRCLGTDNTTWSNLSTVTINVTAAPPPTAALTLIPWCHQGLPVITLATNNMATDGSSGCSGSASTIWPFVPTNPITAYVNPNTNYSLTCTDTTYGPASDSVQSLANPCNPVIDPPCPTCPPPPKKPRFIEF